MASASSAPSVFQFNGAAFGGGQHHQAHNTFAVHTPLFAGHPDFAFEGGSGLGEFARCAGVQAEFVDDFDFLFEHNQQLSSGGVVMAIMPLMAAWRTFSVKAAKSVAAGAYCTALINMGALGAGEHGDFAGYHHLRAALQGGAEDIGEHQYAVAVIGIFNHGENMADDVIVVFGALHADQHHAFGRLGKKCSAKLR